MGFLCRCTNDKCKKRRVLPTLPENYITPPKCKGCGKRSYRWDRWQEKYNATHKCDCGGYHFRHRKGSKWCEFATHTVTPEEAAKRWGGDPLDYHFVSDSRLRIGIIVSECPF